MTDKKDGVQYLIENFDSILSTHHISVATTFAVAGATIAEASVGAAVSTAGVGTLVGTLGLGAAALGGIFVRSTDSITRNTYTEKAKTTLDAKKRTTRKITAEDIPDELWDDVEIKNKKLFLDKMFDYADRQGLSEVELYKSACLSRAVFSNIRSMTVKKKYRPGKVAVLCLCIALKLSAEEAGEMLELLGYSFSQSDRIDVIIHWVLSNTEFSYSVDVLNEIIYDKLGVTLVA